VADHGEELRGPVQHLLERGEEKPVLDFLLYGLVPLVLITQLNRHWRFPVSELQSA